MIGLRKSASGAVLGLVWLAACGGDSPSPAPGTSPDQASSSLTLMLSSAVDCPELNTPTLLPGDGFTATIASRNATCGFIDSLNPADSNFQGTITVTTTDPGPPGGGSDGGYGGGY